MFGDPYGGGWMEWPAGEPNKIAAVRHYENAIILYKANSGQPKWVDANPDIFRVITEIWKMRKEAGCMNYMF